MLVSEAFAILVKLLLIIIVEVSFSSGMWPFYDWYNGSQQVSEIRDRNSLAWCGNPPDKSVQWGLDLSWRVLKAHKRGY